MIILKLGGSIITEKGAREPTIHKENLNRIAQEIKNATSLNSSISSQISDSDSSDSSDHLDSSDSLNKSLNLIIVHGAGSFGHPFASEYEIGKKIKNEEEFKRKRIGFSITQSWVKKLNTLVCKALMDHGIPAVSIQPSSFVITREKRIETADLQLIKKYLENGFVPVIYGDVVLDSVEDIKIAVLSGDQIINYLAKHLLPKRVILATDVDGVFNKNPKKHKDAFLIKEFKSLDDLESFDSTTNIDVTGGMVGKLRELLQLAELGIESEIVNAEREKLVEKALSGEKVKGTTIKSLK